MNVRFGLFLAFLLTAFLLSACGYWPPVVDSRRDIEHLAPDTRSVRARFLPEVDFDSLERLTELRDLDFGGGCALGDSMITDEGVARLVALDLPKLEFLDFAYCGITGAALAHVGTLSTLRMLLLPGCPRITDEGLVNLVAMERLEYLDLRGCDGITDRGVEILGAKSNWTGIEFGGCARVTPEAVARLQAALPAARIAKNDEEWSWSRCR